ncbi:MAG: DUF4097 domain-containing protein [Gemmatimonadota bacterium]
MMANLAAVIAASLSLAQQTDTTFAVGANPRLELKNYSGDVVVTTWDRNEVRIVAEHGSRDRPEIERDGSEISVRMHSRWGVPAIADFDITVPRNTDLEISGVGVAARIMDIAGDVSIESVEGGIELVGGEGVISLSSVEGDISVEDASGKIAITAVDGDISVRGSEGSLTTQTVDGEIILEGIDSDDVEASTVDGDITYQGSITDGGRYTLSTHDGDLSVTIPEGANARVSVATFSGELDTDFPVEIEGDIGRKRFSFTLGTGKAVLELSAFDGTIGLRRP